jgi:protein arginine N-methyltransferase 1
MYLSPVECERVWEQVEFWRNSPAGFDFQPAGRLAANTDYIFDIRKENILGAPQIAGCFDLNSAEPGAVILKGSFVVEREGILHGIGGWCSATLSKNVTITNSPLDRDRINRRNVFFPIENPVQVAAGDQVDVEMHIRSTEIVFSWTIEVWQASNGDRQARVSKGSFRHSTFRGMPLSKEYFERTRPQFVPKLSSLGEARRSVLELCDGKRPLAEIEAEMYRRYAGLFRSYQQAAAFVAEVTTLYAI